MILFFDYLIKISTLSVSALVGAAAVFIAYQQWRLAQHKIRMDLYERRIAVYKETKSFIMHALKSDRIDKDVYMKYYYAIAEAEFLFEQDIVEFTTKLYLKGQELDALTALRSLDPSYSPPARTIENTDPIKEIDAHQKWFGQQLSVATDLFHKHLKISI